jgi:hypothetical protein
MPHLPAAAIAALIVAALALAFFLIARKRHRPRGAVPEPGPRGDAVPELESTTLHRMRVTAHELRVIGMSLHWQADRLSDAGLTHAGSIATAAADLFDLADDLHEYTSQAGALHNLRDEEISLVIALDDALSTVSAMLGPGHRDWQVAPELPATRVTAGRRALRHVLTRVLTCAARNAKPLDRIEITLEPCAEGLSLVVSDTALCVIDLDEGSRIGGQSRGLATRLGLARELMRAQGGELQVSAGPEGGNRVSLVFPTGRITKMPIQQPRMPVNLSLPDGAIGQASA